MFYNMYHNKLITSRLYLRKSRLNRLNQIKVSLNLFEFYIR